MKPINEIVTISRADGAYWSDWVCISPEWPVDCVSPACEDTGYHHNISLRGPGSGRYQGTDWQQTTSHPYRCIHRGCLSTLCRRTNANPRLAWEGLTPVDDRSPELNDPGSFSDYITDHGLIDKLTYHYDRTGQSFDYVQWCQVDGVDYYDLASLDELQWILARPDVFPKLQTRMPCTCTVRSVIDESVPSMRVFTVPELLNTILSFLLDISDQALADAVMELESDEHDPAPVVQSTATLLALSEVDWFFFHTVVCERQGLFLRLARLYGWMLPATPADWASWRSEQPLDSRLGTRRDWREYVLQHLRGEDPHAKSRRRIFSMVTQCVKGVDSNSNSQMPGWQWALQVGEPGYRPGFTVPKAWSWEITGGSKEKDHADGEEEEHFRSDRGKGEAEANNDEEE